jgi:hypothetical protein
MGKMKKDLCSCGKEKDVRSKHCTECYCSRPKKKYYCECGQEIEYRVKHCKKCSLTKYHPMLGKIKDLNPNYKDGKFCNNKCLDCGKLIEHDSIRCWDCYVKWSQIPENNPNYIHGKCYEPYPLGWTKTFKEQIRFRDHYKCQICGCHEVENCRRLDVHHIDYNKENLNLHNLISLCQGCHGKTNFNRDYWYKKLKDKVTGMIKKTSMVKN